jgi:bifunctional UDP-N-acetylglucosamine pyrophosphorylase / glucosamine-1-phosphate N-acetyltransferase
MITPPLLTSDQLATYLDPTIHPALWTAIIPAAGRGTRLGFDQPKILYPIAGRTILEWLVDLLAPLCSQFIFVLSPQGADPVQRALSQLLPGRSTIATQPEPIGMADAIVRGLASVETRNTIIVWGDQVALRPSSLDLAMRLHQGPLQSQATCPTLWRDHPYIHFERDAQDRVIRILQARENDAMPERGESDSGVFLFDTGSLRRKLPLYLESPHAIGRRTRELNFLPILTMIDRLITTPIMTEAESVGVNSPEDARYLEQHLLARKVSA